MNKTHGRAFFQTQSAAELFYNAIPQLPYSSKKTFKSPVRVKLIRMVIHARVPAFVVAWWIAEN